MSALRAAGTAASEALGDAFLFACAPDVLSLQQARTLAGSRKSVGSPIPAAEHPASHRDCGTVVAVLLHQGWWKGPLEGAHRPDSSPHPSREGCRQDLGPRTPRRLLLDMKVSDSMVGCTGDFLLLNYLKAFVFLTSNRAEFLTCAGSGVAFSPVLGSFQSAGYRRAQLHLQRQGLGAGAACPRLSAAP